MTKHFDNLAAAIESLQHRFKEVAPGLWANLPDRVRATVHPIKGSDAVIVCYSHIEI